MQTEAEADSREDRGADRGPGEPAPPGGGGEALPRRRRELDRPVPRRVRVRVREEGRCG